MLATPVVSSSSSKTQSRPFCGCWATKTPVSWSELNPCCCGEISGADCEWFWESSTDSGSSLVLSEDKKQVTFHPFYSSGTAVVKGDTPFVHNVHYYWEVKVLTETYGTDIIIGVGTGNLDVNSARFTFASLLGSSEESYGLSYTGKLRHMDWEIRDAGGFCRGTIVGVRVDMWLGTLEFYLNRKPQGISFYNLRRHEALYPMISSTAAQSTMRLVYAGSHRGSLLVDALKILAASANPRRGMQLPPGLQFASTSQFWLSLPTDGDGTDNGNVLVGKEAVKSSHFPLRAEFPEPRYGIIPIREDAFLIRRTNTESSSSPPLSSSSSSTASTDILMDIFVSHTLPLAGVPPSLDIPLDVPRQSDPPSYLNDSPQT